MWTQVLAGPFSRFEESSGQTVFLFQYISEPVCMSNLRGNMRRSLGEVWTGSRAPVALCSDLINERCGGINGGAQKLGRLEERVIVDQLRGNLVGGGVGAGEYCAEAHLTKWDAACRGVACVTNGGIRVR